MIAKLRHILGLQTAEEKLEEYTLLKGELSDINDRTDILAEDYVTKLNGFNDILKSESYGTEIKERVQKRYTHFLQEQKKEVIGLVNRRHKIEKSISSILKDEKIKDAVNEFELLEKAKSNYRDGNISKNVYNDIIKAKKGKVHYSDNFVFWNGKLLLIQRATDDDGANKWGVPGGHVDAGESHEDAAVRELQEETGLVVDNVVLAGTYSNDDVMIEYYTSHIESDTEPQLVLDTAEHQSYRWIDLYRDNIDEFEFPFNMKENIKKLLLPKEEKPQDISKAVNMFIDGFISKEVLSDIVKARSGVYENTPENRKLGRVGQKYGLKKETEKKDDSLSKEDREKNFKEWFGDSKVVDSDGEPLVVYHGTNKDFTEFKNSDGIYFTDNKDHEFIKKTKNTISSFIKITNPYYAKNRYEVESAIYSGEWNNNKSFATELEEKGFDGIIYKGGKDKDYDGDNLPQYVVFNPNQIKSATGNKGTFNPESNDITKSISLFTQGLISKQVLNDIVKARTGRYSDNATNRRLKRVGQQYGSKGGEDTPQSKEGKKEPETDKKKDKDIPIEDYAKQSSETALQEAAKGGDEELRLAAKKELDRREKEENIKEDEEGGELSFEKDESGKLGNNYNLKQGQKTVGFLETKEKDDSIEIMKVKLDEGSRGKGLYLEFLVKLLNEKGKPIVSRNTDRNESSDKVWEKLKNRKDVVVSETKIGGDESLKLSLNKEVSSSDQPEKENVSANTEKKPGEEKSPVSEKEDNPPLTTEGIKEKIKELRAIDTDDLEEISRISDDISKLLEKLKRANEEKKSVRKVSFEEYRKGFNKLETPTDPHKPDYAMEYYQKDAKNIKATEQELADVAEYTGENYSYARQFLSDPEGYKSEYGVDELMQPMIDGISSFIGKNKIKENLSLNRRVKGDGVNFFKSLNKGDVYEDKSFSSTSLTEQSIFGDFNIEILAKKGSSVANIGNEDELEYLIDKGAKFRVLDKIETGIIVELL